MNAEKSTDLGLAGLLLTSVYLDIIPQERNKLTFIHRKYLNACSQNSSINSL